MEGQVEEGSPSRAEGRKASGLGTEDHTLTEPDLPQPTHGLWHINSLDPHTASRSGHSLEAGGAQTGHRTCPKVCREWKGQHEAR